MSNFARSIVVQSGVRSAAECRSGPRPAL